MEAADGLVLLLVLVLVLVLGKLPLWDSYESVVVSCVIWTFGPYSNSTLMQVTTIFF